MSLLKTNGVQIGQSVTATQNFTLYTPVTPDGSIRLSRGNSGATTQDVLTVNSSGGVLLRLPTTVISSNTAAVAGTYYVATATLTLTLPASPTVGDSVGFSNQSGVTTCIIARNGSNILSLAEDLTVDKENAAFWLQYSGATKGWVFV